MAAKRRPPRQRAGWQRSIMPPIAPAPDLPREKGAFPLFDRDALSGLRPCAAFAATTFATRSPTHGIRNALLTSIAPTGTISLFAGNVSSGIEPIFSTSYERKILMPDGSRRSESDRGLCRRACIGR